MRKVLLALIGAGFLAVAAGVLWIARGPVGTYEVTTGSALEPVALAVEAAGDFDQDGADSFAPGGGATGPNAGLPADPSGDADLLAEPLTLDALPLAAPEIETLSEVPLTSDMVLDEPAPILIEPLDPLEDRAEAEESRGGPVVPTAFEQRVVEMEWPSQFRVGGSGTVRVRLKMLDDGSIQPVAEIEGNEISASPILIADNYTTHNAQVTASISAPDFKIEALNPETQTLLPGGEAQWIWTLAADHSGRGVIAVGITLTWVSKADGRAETTLSLWGQVLEADINYVFGSITVPQASIGGTVLAVLGFIAQLPLLDAVLEVISKVFFGGRRRSKARRRT